MEVSEVECPDILSGYNVAVELIVTPIDLILTGKTDAIKQGAASGMGAGAEGGGQIPVSNLVNTPLCTRKNVHSNAFVIMFFLVS